LNRHLGKDHDDFTNWNKRKVRRWLGSGLRQVNEVEEEHHENCQEIKKEIDLEEEVLFE
jgi:hypothetical protein